MGATKQQQKQAKKNARFKAKIDKISPQVQEFRRLLEGYRVEFNADDEIDKQEQRVLDKMIKKIDKIEARIAKWQAKIEEKGETVVSSMTNQLPSKVSSTKSVERVKELRLLQERLNVILSFFDVA